jgi:hypothetical protein
MVSCINLPPWLFSRVFEAKSEVKVAGSAIYPVREIQDEAEAARL